MARKDKLIRTTALVTVVIILSKMFGLMRDVITAGYFGTGVENDAYASAYTLFYFPVLLFNSCITATIVPLFVEEREKYSLRHSNHFASNALNLFILAALIISAVMYAFAEPIVNLIYRFDAEGIALTVKLTRIMMLGLAFNVASIVISSLLNAMEKFMAAQLTGFPLTFALLIATIGFSGTMGGRALAWGVFFSGILQVLVLLPAMRKIHGFRPSFDLGDPHFRRLMLLAGPAVMNMAVNELNHMVDKMLASSLPAGHLTCMNLAFKLITFLTGVVLVPLETIMFSKMSMKTAAHDEKGLSRMVMRSMELVALIIFPIIAVSAIMPGDVIRLAYKHGVFSEESVTAAGIALRFYILGVFSYGMRDILTRAFNACQDTRTPMLNAVGTVVVNIVLNVLLVRVMGVGGLALATSISATAGVVSLMLLLRRRLGRMRGRRTVEELLKIAIATALAALACMLLNHFVPAAATSLGSFGRLVLCTGVSLIVYAAAVIGLRVRWAMQGVGMIKEKLHR